MKILSLSNIEIWPMGQNKGIPSIHRVQKGLVDLGHEVHFLSPLKVKGNALEENDEGIQIHRFRCPFGINSLTILDWPRDRFFVRVAASLICRLEWILVQFLLLFLGARWAKRVKPDIIYVHGLSPAFPGWILSRIYKAKLVIRVYGVRDLYIRRKSFLFRLKELQNFWAFKIPADLFVITQDGTGGVTLAKSYGVDESRIFHVRNGVDFSSLEVDAKRQIEVLEKWGLDDQTPFIITSSRLTPFKGIERLVKLLPVLFRIHSTCRCVIAGQGPLKDQLQKFVEENNIADRVIFTGGLPREEILCLLKKADIFVTLSSISNCGNSLWEAMMAGKCVLSLKEDLPEDTAADVIHSGKNGVLIDQDELAALPRLVAELLNENQYRHELGIQAQEWAQTNLLTWEQRVNQENTVLQQLVAVPS